MALLADPTRLAIVALLAERPRRPLAIATALRLSRSTVSRQLRLLEEAGIVLRQSWLPDRRSYLFHVHPNKVRSVIAWLAGTGVTGEPP